MEQARQKRTACLVGVPLDLGAGRRGVDMGPSAMRRAGIATRLESIGYRVVDSGNIEAPVAEALGGPVNPSARYLTEVAGVLERVAERVSAVRERGRLPVVLGGDHSIALGTVSGMARGEAVGLLWVDAHADANTPETSPSGNLHGMPVAAILGRGPRELTGIGGFPPGSARVAPERTALVGVRSVDPGEAELLSGLGVRMYTMEEVDRRGIGPVVDEAVAVVLDGAGGFHLSVDLDALDPSVAPGVGTPERGGLTYREAHTLMEAVAASGGLRSVEVAEVNPIRDIRNQTAELAVDLVSSALGKRILPAGAAR